MDSATVESPPASDPMVQYCVGGFDLLEHEEQTCTELYPFIPSAMEVFYLIMLWKRTFVCDVRPH